MQTILGANGIIATELAKELYSKFTKDIKLVSRHPKKVNDSDILFPANLMNSKQTFEAVKGSEIVYLTVYENDYFPTGIGIVFCEVDEDARQLILKLNLAAKLVEFSNNTHKASMAYNHIA